MTATRQTYQIPPTFGWSTVACPGCSLLITPKEPSVTVSGQWLPWHTACLTAAVTAAKAAKGLST